MRNLVNQSGVFSEKPLPFHSTNEEQPVRKVPRHHLFPEMDGVNLIPISSPAFIAPELLDGQPDWALIFGNNNPLVLEIGCGVGDFVTDMASRHHDRNFIAIDYYNKGCLKTCKRIDRTGLTNVRVARDEARSFLIRCIAPASLSGVIINCPDPWPKKRHRKRRMVNPAFMRFLEGFMQPGADFNFATDFDDYGRDVAEFMPELPCFENMLAPDLYRHALDGYPLSKYMLKFMAEGKQIYFVHYRKLGSEDTPSGVTGGLLHPQTD